MSILESLRHQASVGPDSSAIFAAGYAPLSWAGLLSGVDETAGRLRAYGVRPGMRVASVLPPGRDAIVTSLGIMSVAASAPLNPLYGERECEDAFTAMGIDAVVLRPGDGGAARRVAHARGLPVLELERPPREPLDWRDAHVERGGDALVLRTSGTTSAMKTVALTGDGIRLAAEQTAAALALGASDRCLNLLPMFHLSGTAFGTLTPLLAGGSVVALESPFDARTFFALLREFEPTWFSATPTVFAAILKRAPFEPGPAAGTSLRFIRSSAAALSPQLLAALETAFGVPVVEAYSLTEAPGVTSNSPHDRVPGSVGRSLGAEISIDGGHIRVRGPSVMRGYDGPERGIDADGWLDTGDLGYLDGEERLFITGRAKEMINRGGEVIAPKEIEDVLLDHPAVIEAAAFAVPDERLGETAGLAVVLRPGECLDADAVRDFIAARLSAAKVPGPVLFLDALPKGGTGKVLRRELSAAAAARTPQAESAGDAGPPQSPLEATVAEVWREFFDVADVPRNADFFDYGGDSLLAMRFVARLNARCNIDLPLHRFFAAPTLAGIASELERTPAGAAPAALARCDTDRPVPLTSQQRRIWFVHQLSTAPAAFNLRRGIRIRGPLDGAALCRAVAAVAARHGSLRARFSMASGEPLQTFDAGPHLTRVVDVGDAADADAALRELAAAEAATPFDLETGPPFRSTLIRIAPGDHALLLSIHHIAADRWSLALVLDEIAAQYRRACTGADVATAEPAVRYGDFAHRQHAQAGTAAAQRTLAYWHSQLAGPLALAEFPPDHRRADGASDVRTRQLRIDAGRTNALRALAGEEGATLFAVTLALFAVLLARYSGRTRMLVGVPVAGRTLPETDTMVGMFVNALPILVEVDESAPFAALVRDIARTALDALDHQDIPYEALVEALRPPRTRTGSPFFATLFALQNTPAERFALADAVATETFAASTAATGLDLNFVAYERDGGLDCVVEYDAARYDDATIERILRHYANLAGEAVTLPSRPAGELDPLSSSERRTIVHEWNDTGVAGEPSPARRLQDLFAECVRADPEKIAAIDRHGTLTYRELDRRANALAHALRERGVRDGDCVGSCLLRSTTMLVAVLAIMKAGAVCVPLDPGSPRERLRLIVAKADPPVVLVENATLTALAGLDAPVLDVQSLPASTADAPPPSAGDGSSLAYILFTSGSTGEPQGVMLEHRGFVNYVRTAATYGIEPDDRVLQFMSLNFDVSTGEIWSALCNGAALCLRDDEMIASPARFLARCAELQVSVCILPTVYFHELAAAFAASPLKLPDSVRLVAFAGEAVRADLVQAWLAHAGEHARLLNHYGPTEATIAVTAHECNPFRAADAESMSIGRPIANLRCYVLDPRLRPVPIGVSGELYLAGVGLARGYLDNPARTAERFVPDPFAADPGERMYKTGDAARYRADGTIEFIGRTDYQIKIRGFRVEPGEIETALKRHPAVREAVVIAAGDGGDKRLVAFVTVHPGATLRHAEVRAFLGGTLPDYMLPAKTVLLEAFPLTTSGKIDRRALPALEPATVPATTAVRTGDYDNIAPEGGARNLLEVQLAEIFGELLGVPGFTYEDDFFAHGGHSLLAARLVTRIEAVCGEPVAIRTLFEDPTPRRLAARIIASSAGAGGILQRIQDGTKSAPLFFLFGDLSGSGIYVRRLARTLEDRAFYTLPPHGTNGIPELDTPEAMGEHYARLIAEEYPDGPYLLAGYCNGGVVAYEIARRLRARGATVGPLVLIGSPAYGTALRSIRNALRLVARVLRRPERDERQWFRRFRKRFIDIVQLRGQPPRTYLPFVQANLRGLLRRPAATNGKHAVDEFEALLDRYKETMAGYVPAPYDGPVHLVWGEDDTPLVPDPTMGWGAVTSNLTVHRVPGDHTTMVTGENAQLARVIRETYAGWD